MKLPRVLRDYFETDPLVEDLLLSHFPWLRRLFRRFP